MTMRRRSRRVVLGVAALGAALAAGLVARDWRSVRDHLVAWRFQLTRETEATDPFSVKSARLNDQGVLVFQRPGLEILSAYAKRSIVFDPGKTGDFPVWRLNLTAEEVVRVLREEGYRVIDQRFPRKAYVIIRAGEK